MNERCPLPSSPTTETGDLLGYERESVVADANIPMRCFGCAALAISGIIPSQRKEIDQYDKVLSDIKNEDPDFDDDQADKFTATSFLAPSEQDGSRTVVYESGFEYGGWNEAVTGAVSYSFDCPQENQT